MELEIIDFDMFPPDAAPAREQRARHPPDPRRSARCYPRRDLTPRRQEAMFFPEAEEII